ncbi:MAG: PfkB family carbohydrate kinase, partial [Xanthobacteraceae bacterium]
MGGPPGADPNGDRVLDALLREGVDCTGCRRVPGLATALSAIFIDARGDRMIVTYRDERVAAARPADADGLAATADVVVADNRYPDFVMPICTAARRRAIPVVLDADRPTFEDDPLFAAATHLIFSSECLRETTGIADLAAGLSRIAAKTEAFLAVSNGADDIVYLKNGKACRLPVFALRAVDTLGAGDALHGGFALALAEGQSELEAMRFAAAVAGIKCTRIGGGGGMPMRAEVEAFLAERAEAASVRAGAREIP